MLRVEQFLTKTEELMKNREMINKQSNYYALYDENA